jgi:hypothetical protein
MRSYLVYLALTIIFCVVRTKAEKLGFSRGSWYSRCFLRLAPELRHLSPQSVAKSLANLCVAIHLGCCCIEQGGGERGGRDGGLSHRQTRHSLHISATSVSCREGMPRISLHYRCSASGLEQSDQRDTE